MRKFTLLIAACFSMLLFGCDLFKSGSSIKGTVVDIVTKKPIAGITVIAATKTDIEEDKKYEKITAITNNDGKFQLKGLSSSYKYIIAVGGKC